jgi:hypothetical protein
MDLVRPFFCFWYATLSAGLTAGCCAYCSARAPCPDAATQHPVVKQVLGKSIWLPASSVARLS